MNLIYFFGIPVFDDGSKAIKHDGELRKAFYKFLNQSGWSLSESGRSLKRTVAQKYTVRSKMNGLELKLTVMGRKELMC